MTRTRKRTYLEPGIKVLRIVDDVESQKLNGVKIECQMETTKHRLTFELHTADIGPEEMANTFISEDLLAEQHRQIFVDQLGEIARQLRKNPATLPELTFLPNRPQSCCTRGGRRWERSRSKSLLINLLPSSLQRMLGLCHR